MNVPQRVLDRFWLNVLIGDPEACWPHLGRPVATGYSQVGWGENGKTRTVYGHRIAWFLVHGPIPEDLTIDHICHNRVCVNPSHLRLLTRVENGRDGARHRRPGNHHVRHRLNRNNLSGERGVVYSPQLSPKKPWRAVITVGRKQHHLGLHATKAEAVAARKAAEASYWGAP